MIGFIQELLKRFLTNNFLNALFCRSLEKSFKSARISWEPCFVDARPRSDYECDGTETQSRQWNFK